VTQYILNVQSYVGIVAGATHYKGTVKGPHPESCHGGTRFNGQAGPLHGKTTCFEGHELPGQVEWQVEARWTEARYERYAAAHFEGDGPSQFRDKQDVIDTAILRFLGDYQPAEWWEDKGVPVPEEGDELWYGWVCPEGFEDDQDEDDGWGCMIARRCTT
jgi:hypothetical protein